MKAMVSFKVGDVAYQLSLEERDEMDTLHKMAVLGNPPTYCKFLPKGRVSLESNKDTEGNTYVNVVCKGTDDSGQFQVYKAKLGQYKAGGYFWHNWALDEYAIKRVAAQAQDLPDDVSF
jgi:hypothetical protein